MISIEAMATFGILTMALCIYGVLATTGLGFVPSVRQNFDETVNAELRKQIHYELTASYVYEAYASFFGRADIALPGFKKFFSAASDEERKHAQHLINYVNLRGGYVDYGNIHLSSACYRMADEASLIFQGNRTRACICEFLWTMSVNHCGWYHNKQYGLQAMEDALALERFVNDKLLYLHKVAESVEDFHLAHVLEHEFLEEQVNSIREFAGYVTRLRSFESNYALGEYMFDQKLQ